MEGVSSIEAVLLCHCNQVKSSHSKFCAGNRHGFNVKSDIRLDESKKIEMFVILLLKWRCKHTNNTEQSKSSW